MAIVNLILFVPSLLVTLGRFPEKIYRTVNDFTKSSMVLTHTTSWASEVSQRLNPLILSRWPQLGVRETSSCWPDGFQTRSGTRQCTVYIYTI